MEKWLGLDSKFYKWGTWFVDTMQLMILWAICCLPVITIGASTTAVYYVATRQISGREGYIGKDFFKSFFSNFFKATAITVILEIFAVVEFINIMAMDKGSLLFPIQFVIVYELFAFSIFVFPLLARFDFKFTELLRNAFLMANRHILTVVSCFIMLAAGAFLMVMLQAPIYVYPIVVIIVFAVYTPVSSLMFMNVFRKYVPDMDVDKEDNFSIEDDTPTDTFLN